MEARTKKIIFWGGFAIVAAGALYWLYSNYYGSTEASPELSEADKALPDEKETHAEKKRPLPIKSSEVTNGIMAPIFPLKQGNRNPDVKYLQKALNRLGSNLKVDGIFGQKTYNQLIGRFGTAYYPLTIKQYAEVLKRGNDATVK